MKKLFTLFLTLILVAGFLPINLAKAITQNQINAEVQIICPDNYGYIYSGSGTIIDSKGIILTNRHVVTDTQGNIIKYCAVGITNNIDETPSFDYIAETKYYSDDPSLDVAILYIDNQDNSNFSYVDVFGYDTTNLKLGDGIEVIGYPSVGGETITYVNGVMSGLYGNFIKTTAPLEHGNSGGSAFTFNGNFIGIPTAVVSGSLNSISYILDINKIKNWLQNKIGNNYLTEIPKQTAEPTNTKIETNKDIYPPSTKNVVAAAFDSSEKNKNLSFDFKHTNDKPYFTWQGFYDNSGIKGYYVYFGTDLYANPITEGEFTESKYYTGSASETNIYYFKISAIDKNNNVSNPVTWNYFYNTEPLDAGINSVDYYSRKAYENRPTKFYIYDYSDGYKGQLFKTIYFDQNKIQNVSVPTNNLYIEWQQLSDTDFIQFITPWFFSDSLKQQNYNDIIFDPCREFNSTDKRPIGVSIVEWWDSHPEDNKNWSECVDEQEKKYFISSKKTHIIESNLQVGASYNFVFTSFFNNETKNVYDSAYTFNIFSVTPTASKQQKKSMLAENLKGNILLQVEKNGEAYYVYPDDASRYFLGRPDDAFQVMRNLGLGATHDFISGNTIFPPNVSGKILLDVEKNGEAYYIYPKDRKAYYLGRPADAFQIMRELGLGITNNDLIKIPVGNL